MSFPPIIPGDKANHCVYGVVSYVVFSFLANLAGQHEHARLIGVASSLVFGYIKDYVIDRIAVRRAIADGKLPTHTVDPMDVVATLVGGLLGLAAEVASDPIVLSGH